MKRLGHLVAVVALLFAVAAPATSFLTQRAAADAIAGETFMGEVTQNGQWTSGGTPGACLTAGTDNIAGSIPACDTETPIDEDGEGALRLTSAINNQSGFAFYNTPIASDEGLKVSFDMFQWGASSADGADGISFFLIDGAQSPTQPGALGGSLGYSSSNNGVNPGLVGGYVGVGFDRYGNFSHPSFGTGGTNRYPNSVTVRGSQGSGYQYVTRTAADGQIANEDALSRDEAKRHVVVTVSTNNIMNVKVDYNDGQGLRTELSNINLNTINGAGSLPATFKFGFAASTGGSNNFHEIQGLTIDPLDPELIGDSEVDGVLRQNEKGAIAFTVANSAGGESTTGTIYSEITLPEGLTPTAVTGDGWTCNIAAQVITCQRPGSGANVLDPGEAAPDINVAVTVAADADTTTPLEAAMEMKTTGSSGEQTTLYEVDLAVLASADDDMIADSVEAAAPNSGDANNDGTPDKDQPAVTSLPNTATGNYTVIESDGCIGNRDVSVDATRSGDSGYTYIAGMTNFTIDCTQPGDSATVTLYYYGVQATSFVLRKYNAATKQYATVADAAMSRVTIGGQQVAKITYTLTDGGTLDEDGVADGSIVDPVGPAMVLSSVVAPSTGLPQANSGLWALTAGTFGLALVVYVARGNLWPRRQLAVVPGRSDTV